ncbi:MAG: SiaC family regulatory phosphoprotein [Bacteroidota bacterium]|nr:SiaC family regulatory phosphoprotein [Bacteroidota bacterium]
MIISEKTLETPYISVDNEKGIFELEGRSMPENPLEIYSPLIETVKKYNLNPKNVTVVVFDLEFINSTSLRFLTLFIKAFDIKNPAFTIKFIWNYKGFEQVLPSGYSPEEFFSKLTTGLNCRKQLIVKKKVNSENSSNEEVIEL